MKLTATHKKAGIVKISPFQNTNGSWTCLVKIEKIDTHDNRSNFRTCDDKHVGQLLKRYNKRSQRNPILRYEGRSRKLISLDGRHTISANRHFLKQGKTELEVVSCDIHFGLTNAQAASIFYDLTMYSKRMDPWSAFHAAKLAKYDFAVDTYEAIQYFGFTTKIDHGMPPRGRADITNVDPLYQSYAAKRHYELLELLTLFVMNDGNLDKPAKAQRFQLALLDIILYHDISMRELRRYIGQRTASYYTDMAADFASEYGRRLDRQHYRMAFELQMPKRLRLVA